jgi:hypothetical protein
MITVRRAASFGIVLISLSATSRAQDMPVPVDVQFSIITKVLAFDRTLREEGKSEVVVGILFQSTFRLSVIVKDKFLAARDGSPARTIDGRGIRCVAIDFDGGERQMERAPFNDLDALYIAPLRAVSLDAITAMCRTEGIVTLTGVPDYIDQGIAVALSAQEDKPVIIINVQAAKKEGAEFDSQLMRVARSIR